MGRRKRLARLTPQEDRAWTNSFEYYMNEGHSEAYADRHAWKDIQEQFPRLQSYDGALASVQTKRQLRNLIL